MTSRVTTTVPPVAAPNGLTAHQVTLTPTGAGQLKGAVVTPPATNPAAEAVEAVTGGTSPFTALAIGSTPITSPQGAGFWEWKETVNGPLVSPPTPPVAPMDGLETSAEPMIQLKAGSVSMPSSYLGESLTGLNPDYGATDFGTSNIFPGINLVTSAVTDPLKGYVPVGTPTPGVGTIIAKAQITGNILELNSWVDQWLPTSSVPKFDGSDYAKVKSEGFGRDNPNGFEIQFTLRFFLKLFANHPQEVEKTFSIKIINNFSNDKEQYKQDYANAYASLEAVPDPSTWQ